MLPVSSSGHLVLVPALLDLPYLRLDPELRKSFEVALHVGTVAGLLVALRGRLARDVRELGAGGLLRLPLTFAPAAIAGLAFERPIERHLGTPRAVAAAQVGAGLALWLADRGGGSRPRAGATAVDALWLGAAQATALLPGVSRAGATLTAARARGFDRPAASALAREAALPVIAGAALLKGARMRRRGLPARLRAPFVGGVAAAAASTIAAARLTGVLEDRRSLAPVAAYRVGLGLVALARLRRRRPAHGVESRT